MQLPLTSCLNFAFIINELFSSRNETDNSSSRSSMDTVFRRIKELELPFESDKNTLGGGNCFFHAVLQQGKRDGISVGGMNHQWLRERIADYATKSSNGTVALMKENFDLNAGSKMSWIDFWKRMRKKGEFVEGPVVEVTALFLGINIIVVSPENNNRNPWLEISGGEGADQSVPILLANLPGVHYQSLLPVAGFQHWYSQNKSPSSVSIVEDSPPRDDDEKTRSVEVTKENEMNVAYPEEKEKEEISVADMVDAAQNDSDSSILQSHHSEDTVAPSQESILEDTLNRHNLLLGALVRDHEGAIPLVLPILKLDEDVLRMALATNVEVEETAGLLEETDVEKTDEDVGEFFINDDASDLELSMMEY